MSEGEWGLGEGLVFLGALRAEWSPDLVKVSGFGHFVFALGARDWVHLVLFHNSIMPCKGRNDNIYLKKLIHRVIHRNTKKGSTDCSPETTQRFLKLLRWRKGNRNENLDASRRGWRTHRKKGKEKPPTMKGSLRVFFVVFPIAEEQKTRSLVYHY